jgi:hypothetical protein
MRSRKIQQVHTCVSSRRHQVMDAPTSSNRSSSSTSESPSLPSSASLSSLEDQRSSSTPPSLVASACLSPSSPVKTSTSSSTSRPPPANTNLLFVAVITKPSALLTPLSRFLSFLSSFFFLFSFFSPLTNDDLVVLFLWLLLSHAHTQNVVDGDLCEQYLQLDFPAREEIAGELDRSINEVLKKLEDIRNRCL